LVIGDWWRLSLSHRRAARCHDVRFHRARQLLAFFFPLGQQMSDPVLQSEAMKTTRFASPGRSAETPNSKHQPPVQVRPATPDEVEYNHLPACSIGDVPCSRADEIDGYLELGMAGEALDRVGETLSRPQLTPDEFQGCVFALLQNDGIEEWQKQVELAYRRLTDRSDDRVRSAMLNFYFSINESNKAFLFFPRKSTKFFDAWTMMQVCLDLGRLDEAKKVARYCRGNLASAKDDFTRASMIDALGAYHLRMGEFEPALALWSEAPVEPAFHRQMVKGVVKARLMQALQAAKLGLATAELMKDEASSETELRLAGNTTHAIGAEAVNELAELTSKIGRFLGEV
jgi:hypothetical protein